MNRLLFIKLFEGQLISFNGDTNNYHILDNDKIQSFQNLQDLFFEILGKRKREDTEFLNQFSDIPYLNNFEGRWNYHCSFCMQINKRY